MVLRIVFRHFIEDALDHGGSEFFRTEAIAPADYARHRDARILRVTFPGGTPVPSLADRGHDILVERLAGASRLFRAIQNGDCLYRGRQTRNKVGYRKWAVQAYFQEANLLAHFS